MQYITIILIAMFIEAVVTAIKPLWSKEDGKKMSVAEIVSIFIGVLLAVTCKLNMLAYFTDEGFWSDKPLFVYYIFYVLTGVALGRGPSFIWDLWQRIKNATNGDLHTVKDGKLLEESLPPLEKWPLDMLESFCELNGFLCENCETRDDYINAILNARKPAAMTVEVEEGEQREQPTDPPAVEPVEVQEVPADPPTMEPVEVQEQPAEETAQEIVSHAQEPPDLEPVTVD